MKWPCPRSIVVAVIILVLLYFYTIEKHILDGVAISGILAGLSFVIPGLKSYRGSLIVLFAYFTMVKIVYMIPFLEPWPMNLLAVGFLVWLIQLAVVRISKNKLDEARFSLKLSKWAWLSVLGVIVPTIGILSLYYWANPEVAQNFPMAEFTLWQWPLVIFAFAFINGFREEFLYRYVLQRTFSRDLGPVLGIFLASAVFGFIHFHQGFPRGVLGVFLTMLFASVVGLQQYYFRSFWLAWLTHALADACMAIIIVSTR